MHDKALTRPDFLHMFIGVHHKTFRTLVVHGLKKVEKRWPKIKLAFRSKDRGRYIKYT